MNAAAQVKKLREIRALVGERWALVWQLGQDMTAGAGARWCPKPEELLQDLVDEHCALVRRAAEVVRCQRLQADQVPAELVAAIADLHGVLPCCLAAEKHPGRPPGPSGRAT